MPYKVIWAFGDGASEASSYDNVLDARRDAYERSTRYARQYGTCVTRLYAGEDLIFDLRENSQLKAS